MNKQTNKSLGVLDVLIVWLLLAGLGVFAYPFVSDALVSYQNQQVITDYQQKETRKNQTTLRQEYRCYQRKNQALAAANQDPGVNRFTAAVNDRGTAATTTQRNQKVLTRDTIAQLTIPKIHLSLPVFDHTSDWLLQFGACLLDGTSYPTGQKNTHAVLSAHRGVPNAELFTRLPALKRGDRFFITIGDRKLAYQVFKRQVIEPTATSQLKVVPGQDLVTLMTCTPYMINSQRLLITGRRIPYTPADDRASWWAALWNKLKVGLALIGILLTLSLSGLLLRELIMGRRTYRLVVPAGVTQVIVRRGRRVQSFMPDQAGTFQIQLAGNRYRIQMMTPEGNRHGKAYVRRIRDRELTFKDGAGHCD